MLSLVMRSCITEQDFAELFFISVLPGDLVVCLNQKSNSTGNGNGALGYIQF